MAGEVKVPEAATSATLGEDLGEAAEDQAFDYYRPLADVALVVAYRDQAAGPADLRDRVQGQSHKFE